MSEKIVDQVDTQKVEELIEWVTTHYEQIADICEEKNLPRPPRF